jgi:hypothetical protein
MLRTLRRLWDRAPHPEDRRRACRYPIDDSPVFLGWWEGDRFRSTTALLIDLSMHGASVVAQEAPKDGPVWLCPCHSSPSAWAEGTTVAVGRDKKRSLFRKRWHRLRLEFSGPCSYELFKSGTGTGHVFHREATPEDVKWGSRR